VGPELGRDPVETEADRLASTSRNLRIPLTTNERRHSLRHPEDQEEHCNLGLGAFWLGQGHGNSAEEECDAHQYPTQTVEELTGGLILLLPQHDRIG